MKRKGDISSFFCPKKRDQGQGDTTSEVAGECENEGEVEQGQVEEEEIG